MSRPDPLAVVVAVVTYRRPELLGRLLPLVVDQVTELGPGHRVVVVDNDPGASARATVQPWTDRRVSYHHEPRPGIAAARNRALQEAADADAIVFIDDDEEPSPGWLEALVRTWQRYECDAVAGPTMSVLDEPVSSWIRACPLFTRPVRATGTVVSGAASGNLLIDLVTLRREGLTFSDAYGLTGGSDTLLTRTLTRRGGVIRCCAEAVAHEAVPAERANRSWVLRRYVRVGNAWTRVHLDLADSRRERLRTRAVIIARAVVRVVRGGFLTLRGWVTSDIGRRADGECQVATGFGLLTGVSGRVFIEYRRSPS